MFNNSLIGVSCIISWKFNKHGRNNLSKLIQLNVNELITLISQDYSDSETQKKIVNQIDGIPGKKKNNE